MAEFQWLDKFQGPNSKYVEACIVCLCGNVKGNCNSSGKLKFLPRPLLTVAISNDVLNLIQRRQGRQFHMHCKDECTKNSHKICAVRNILHIESLHVWKFLLSYQAAREQILQKSSPERFYENDVNSVENCQRSILFYRHTNTLILKCHWP
jgi:hypothetical protein